MEVTLPTNDIAASLAHPLVQGLLNATSDGALVIDAKTREILLVNKRAREMLGYSERDMVGCQCQATMDSPSCARACPLTALMEGRLNQASLALYYRGRRGDQLLHAHTRMILLRGPQGEPLAGIELFQDLTEVRRLRRELAKRRGLVNLVGASAAMQPLFDLVEQVAPFEIPVLITGESGVGKERFAEALHTLSARSEGPYVRVNCAALSPGVVESELFGHRKGAFTGANSDRRGHFEEADGGTLLLDEVGELPLTAQAKLLRVLQEGELQRVGEDRPRRVDVRVLAATNRDVEAAVQEGSLREDLYYRLAGVRLHVPALRERIEDLPLLAEHFLSGFSQEADRRGRPRPKATLSVAALNKLGTRSWPGNVRELQNVLQLAWIRAPVGGPIRVDHLPEGPALARSGPRTLAELEREAIDQALSATQGNLSAAATRLGIDRTTLWRKLRRRDQT
jgi:transcriptional regulator with PAS, ATPase and Fis domain